MTVSKARSRSPDYGVRHQRLRGKLLLRFTEGSPCPQRFLDGSLCGKPMWRSQKLELGHAPDRRHYIGLVHASCNHRAGAEAMNAAAGKTVRRRTCPHCGGAFTATRPDQVTCNRTCAAAVKRGDPPITSGRPWLRWHLAIR